MQNMGNTPVPRDRPGGDRGLRETEREIERTMADLHETMDAIKERLDPGRLTTQAKDSIKQATWGRAEEAMQDMKNRAERETTGLVDTIKANPIPAAMAAFGLGWLLFNRKEDHHSGTGYPGYQARSHDRGSQGASGYHEAGGFHPYEGQNFYPTRSEGSYARDWQEHRWQGGQESGMEDVRRRAGEMTGAVQDRMREASGAAQGRAREMADAAQDFAETAQEQMGEASERAQETVSELSEQARMKMEEMRNSASLQAREARGQFDRILSENPLAVGAVALSVGAAIGMMLPETDTERKFLGDASGKITSQAEDVLNETVVQAKERVQRAASAFQDEGPRTDEAQGEQRRDSGASGRDRTSGSIGAAAEYRQAWGGHGGSWRQGQSGQRDAGSARGEYQGGRRGPTDETGAPSAPTGGQEQGRARTATRESTSEDVAEIRGTGIAE